MSLEKKQASKMSFGYRKLESTCKGLQGPHQAVPYLPREKGACLEEGCWPPRQVPTLYLEKPEWGRGWYISKQEVKSNFNLKFKKIFQLQLTFRILFYQFQVSSTMVRHFYNGPTDESRVHLDITDFISCAVPCIPVTIL